MRSALTISEGTVVLYLRNAAIETIMLSLLLMTNDFRIQRILPGYEIPDTGFNRAWDKCDTDLATHARDAFLICSLFAVRSFLGVFIIRARLSWIGSACFCACFAGVLLGQACSCACFPGLSWTRAPFFFAGMKC